MESCDDPHPECGESFQTGAVGVWTGLMADGLSKEIEFWEKGCETYPASETMNDFEGVVLFCTDDRVGCNSDGPEHSCYYERADDDPWICDPNCGVFVSEKGCR